MPWTVLPVGTLTALAEATVDDQLGRPLGDVRAFMKGDGHRNPPFEWINTYPRLKLHFQNLMFANRLCAHVEQNQEDVSETSVANALIPLFRQRRIFGWELPIFRLTEALMKWSLDLEASLPSPPTRVIAATNATGMAAVNAICVHMAAVHAQLGAVNNPPALMQGQARSETFRAYYQGVMGGLQRNLATEVAYRQFRHDYHDGVMALRINAHPFIAARIRAVIDANLARTHIITVGGAHLVVDPLHNHLQLPLAMNGVVDVSPN